MGRFEVWLLRVEYVLRGGERYSRSEYRLIEWVHQMRATPEDPTLNRAAITIPLPVHSPSSPQDRPDHGITDE